MTLSSKYFKLFNHAVTGVVLAYLFLVTLGATGNYHTAFSATGLGVCLVMLGRNGAKR